MTAIIGTILTVIGGIIVAWLKYKANITTKYRQVGNDAETQENIHDSIISAADKYDPRLPKD